MENNRKIKIKMTFFFLIELFGILLLNNIIKGCPIEEPIRYSIFFTDSYCTSRFCTSLEFSDGICRIENDIISTQWLNRMNLIGENGYRFVSMEILSNGDLILEAIENNNNKRYFYRLNQNGSSSFLMEGISHFASDPYFNIFTVFSNKEDNNDKKEYLICIPVKSNKVELYDLENKKPYIKELDDSRITLKNHKYMPFKIIEDDKIFTIFATTISYDSLSYKFSLFKLNVNDSNADEPSLQIVAQSQPYIQSGEMVSCFETFIKKIICFVRTSIGYNIIAFNYNLEEENQESLSASSSGFFKCVHVKENIGGFLYFSGNHPKILFKEYKNENFETLNEVNLNYEEFESSVDFNDFIKISDNKISFISYKEIGNLYIVLLKFIEPDNDIIIRYYSMNIKTLRNHRICCDLVAHDYNNYISLSFNTHEIIDTRGSGHNIIFMLFSYPSISDKTIDLENHIFDNDRLNSYKFETNLKQFVFIENNVFGYIYSKIKIQEIKGCEMFDIILNKNETLEVDYILQNDDNIKLILLNKYKPFSCQIKFIYYASELNYKESQKYTIHEEIISNNNNFNEETYNNQTEIYEGKIGFYKIELKRNLSDTCEGNCKFCSVDSNKNMVKCLICKYDSEVITSSGIKEKICLDKSSSKPLSEIMNNLDDLMKEADPEESYVISGAGYAVIIKDINEYVEDSTVNIDFTKCEEKLRFTLPENIQLRILQLNIEKEDENSLTDQVEYKVYDDKGNSIDLTVCNDVEIGIEYEITDSSSLDLGLISKFSDLGVDVFNINDVFFNDICKPYSDDGSNSDMILSDRVSDIYQNVSLCGDDCDYVSFDIKRMAVNCNCKVKQEASDEPEKGNFASSITSAFLDSNFGVIKCYKLVFSLKGKLKNAGFWIFVIFIIFEIVIYIYYCYTGILPIKKYIEKEMKENGYKVNENEDKKDNNIYKKSENEHIQTKNQSYPPKKKAMQAKNKIKIMKNPFKNIDLNTPDTNTEEVPDKNFDKKTEPNDKDSHSTKNPGVYVKFNKNRNRIKKPNKFNINNLDSKEIMNTNEEIKVNAKNKIAPNTQKVGDHLIFINAKNTDNYIPLNSLYNLDNYDYEEAVEYEDRSFGRIFFIYLMSKEGILNTFYYQQPLELKPLRILMFIFSNACDIALNCFFYLSDNISDKYHYEGKSALLFSLTNNITISLVSSIVGYCLIYFSQSLVQSTDKITILFREQDDLLKKDKHYQVESKKNMDILKEIQKILKCLKIKITIFLIFENLLMLFFFYYVTAFCHVYNSTQTSWLLDSLTSYGISLLTAFAVSFLMSVIYEISIKCKCKILYKITIFIYNGI